MPLVTRRLPEARLVVVRTAEQHGDKEGLQEGLRTRSVHSSLRVFQHLSHSHSTLPPNYIKLPLLRPTMFRSPLSVLRRQQAQIPSRVRAPLTTALPARNIGQRYLWNTRSSKGPNLSTNFSFTSKRLPLLRVDRPQSILQRLRHNLRHFTSSRSRLAEKSELASSGENATLKGRLKKLSREYGWTVVGVYLALSVLDFPFCFLLVRTVGTDRVGK